ncbi:YihY/virulence factor BrkB family protein [Nocardioides mesophilus]|uniref:YihY/virulence factor BrkB family protein n=1 Tax=Nocardioides mesophilus TaxID=433659 RepID=A0A7G9RA44_9ACTN|nr:YihY/virulence factor BrkB family protein [Nocardioides mesophilus]QNN52469.1 YihY/virulence factor BrkB family protein [Nocardioides mesophilus]
MPGDAVSPRGADVARWLVIRDTLWRLVVSTVGTCFRNRVTGLAAEAAFFALLSLPPLLFGLAGSIGYVFNSFSRSQVEQIRTAAIELASRALTEPTVDAIVRPTLNDVFGPGRFDIISIGFILALWSGSRALNVFVDTITIMYGLGGHRGVVRTRVLSFSLYVMGLLTGVVTLPLVVAGPRLVDRLVPERLGVLNELYWPVVLVLCICFLTTLYHVSVPVRTSWRFNIPGATLTLLFWVFGSFLLRWLLTVTAGQSTSIYGPLAAPIVVMLWLYLLSIAILVGAAVNAAFDRLWPEKETSRARMEVVRKLRLRAMMSRLRRDTEEQERFPDAASETMVLRAYDEGQEHDARTEALAQEAAHGEVPPAAEPRRRPG